MFKVLNHFSLLLTGLCVLSCAVPSRPTGGPPDKEGPRVVNVKPESGTVNFDGQSVQFEFSEFVNRESLEDALRIEPDLNLETEINWGRKALEVVFEEPLPDSTTVIVTLGTDFQDVRSNNMESPFTVAVSTGPNIDDSRLKAVLKKFENGRPVAGGRVLLYRTPVDFARPALYTGESDTTGVVNFAYLSPGRYKAFWLDDKNRNRKWDRKIEEAQPFPEEFITLEKEDTDSLDALYVVSDDTLAPTLQAVGLLSQTRLRLRFSETILLTDTTEITVTDTLGNDVAEAVPLYRSKDQPFIAFAQSRESLVDGEFYKLRIHGMTDEAINSLKPSDITFEGSTQQDTTLQRIIRTEQTGGIFSNQPFIVRYARLFNNNFLADSLIVIKGGEMTRPWPKIELNENKLIVRPMNNNWEPGINYEIRVFNPASLQFKKYEPEIWFDADLGGLEFTIQDTTKLQNGVIHLEEVDGEIKRDSTFKNSVLIEDLPPRIYQVRIFEDKNKNGRWDRGSVDPYIAPEPIFIRRNMEVRSGFTATVPIEI